MWQRGMEARGPASIERMDNQVVEVDKLLHVESSGERFREQETDARCRLDGRVEDAKLSSCHYDFTQATKEAFASW